MEREVLVWDYYYHDKYGKLRTQRWIGNQCIYDDESHVVFLDWANIEAVWTTLVKPSTILVKEGPKEIVLYEGGRVWGK